MLHCFTECLIILAVLIALVSCESTKVVVPSQPNLMKSIWADIRSNMARLNEAHASMADWQKSSTEEHPLRSSYEIRKVLKSTHLTLDEVDQAVKAFKAASRSVHFGFDCDYHALVFFDEKNRSSSAIFW